MLTVDPKMLVHSFEYYEYDHKNEWGENKYKPPKTIQNVRVSITDVINKTSKDSKIVANAIIFCYSAYTAPLPNFRKRSKIIAFGKEYELKKVIPLPEPFSDNLWGVELEILGADEGEEW